VVVVADPHITSRISGNSVAEPEPIKKPKPGTGPHKPTLGFVLPGNPYKARWWTAAPIRGSGPVIPEALIPGDGAGQHGKTIRSCRAAVALREILRVFREIP
jgi:hypothetical protein